MGQPKIEMRQPKTEMGQPKTEMCEPKTEMRQPKREMCRPKSPAVERGAWNLCIHVKWGGNLGDFQGVVTLGVARDQKCIFPIRGEGFLEWAPPHVHAKRCTWPRCTRIEVYVTHDVHAKRCTRPEKSVGETRVERVENMDRAG